MEAKTKKTALLLLCSVFAVLAGIAGFQHYLDNVKPPAVSPRQVVEQYFAALKKKDYKKAYEMVSVRHYNNSYNQFIDRVSMYHPDMLVEIQGETIENDTAVVEARVSVPLLFGPYISDANMDLTRIKREWKIIHP